MPRYSQHTSFQVIPWFTASFPDHIKKMLILSLVTNFKMQKDGTTLLYMMDRRAMYNYHQCNSKAYTIHHPSIGINIKKKQRSGWPGSCRRGGIHRHRVKCGLSSSKTIGQFISWLKMLIRNIQDCCYLYSHQYSCYQHRNPLLKVILLSALMLISTF